MIKNLANTSPEEIDAPHLETESQAASSEPVNNMPDNLSLDLLRSELMDNGRLASKTYLGLVKKLREMMQQEETGAEQWLEAIVTLPNWSQSSLTTLLTDDRVQDSPAEDSSSLLRAALPKYLPLLLKLDTVVTRSLIHNLFYTIDKTRKNGIQQLIEARDNASLELIFTTIKQRCPDILTTIPDLAPSFKGAGVEVLLSFSRVQRGRIKGPKFHELTGPEILLSLNTADVLKLIDSLLTQNINSEGIALHLWYMTAKSVDINFHREFLTKQRCKFGVKCSSDFIWDLMTNPAISNGPHAQYLINNLTDVEIGDLALALFESWARHKIRESRYTFEHYPLRAGSERIYHNLLVMLRSHPAKVELILRNVHSETFTFAGLLIQDSGNHITSVMDYYRRVFPQPDTQGRGAVFINNLMLSVNNNPDRGRLIMQHLQREEIESLLNSGKISCATVLGSLPVGTLPYAVVGKHLHANSEMKSVYWQIVPWNTLVGQIPAGAFADLARDLVLYRTKRNALQDQRYSFMGIPGGISKNEKFAVVDKVLTFIYGTETDKQAAGRFTERELLVMNQGELGKVIRSKNVSISQIISLALSIKPVLDTEVSPAASSSSM